MAAGPGGACDPLRSEASTPGTEAALARLSNVCLVDALMRLGHSDRPSVVEMVVGRPKRAEWLCGQRMKDRGDRPLEEFRAMRGSGGPHPNRPLPFSKPTVDLLFTMDRR